MRRKVEFYARRFPCLFKLIQRRQCDAEVLHECVHFFYDCAFYGTWIGMFKSIIPRTAKFIGEECSYKFVKPHMVWLKSKHVANSVQIKYFVNCICESDEKEHTIIYEANVNRDKLWWTYGQPLYKGELEGDRWAYIVNFKKHGKVIRWLKLNDTCYNKHCKRIWAYDACGTQHFVKEHQLCPRK